MPNSIKQLKDVIIVSFILCAFAWLIHFKWPLQIIAFILLLLAAFLIGKSVTGIDKQEAFLGKTGKAGNFILSCLLGLCLGLLLAIWYRNYTVIQLLPKSIGFFAITGASIGACEEFIYRGYIQGHLYNYSKWIKVSIASLSHSSYKCAIFLSPAIAHPVNIPFLFAGTFLGGLLFGWLKEYSRSTIPAIIAHAVFDIIVYGEFVNAPWWVW